MGLRALVQIFLQAPGAVWRGRFDVDETHSVYGLPARIVGLLLMYLGLQAVVLGVVAAVVGKKRLPDELLIVAVMSFLGCVVTSAVICAVFRKRRPTKWDREDDEDEDEDDDTDRRKRPGGSRYWGPGR